MLLALILDPLRRSVGDPYANGGKTRFQPTFGPISPAHILPLGIGEHVFGCTRQDVRNVPLAWTSASSNRPDQLDVDRVHLEVTRDADGPSQPAYRKPLSKRRTETVPCICKHTTEAYARSLSFQRPRFFGAGSPRCGRSGGNLNGRQSRWGAAVKHLFAGHEPWWQTASQLGDPLHCCRFSKRPTISIAERAL
jgi:hypothetical protein